MKAECGTLRPVCTWKETEFHPKLDNCVCSIVKKQTLASPHCDQIDALFLLIVSSGRVNGRTYRADLELQTRVAAERCCWEMKSNEPVLKLVKQQQGHWERFLRNKVLYNYNLFFKFIK